MEEPFNPLVLEAGNPGVMTGAGNRTYLVPAVGGALLIDAGVGADDHLRALDRALHDSHTTLHAVIVTHGHGDHMNGAPAIHARHPGTRFRKYPWSGEDQRVSVHWEPLQPDERLPIAAGELQVLHTPGHAPDHCALWHEPSGSLFAGDLVIPAGSVVIQTTRGGSMRQYMASLERMIALRPRRLFPAHGEPVIDPLRLLAVSLGHRHQREAQVSDAVRAGHDTVAAITESIYHGLPPALMPAAQQNVLAHLEKLRDDGRVAFDGARWHP